MAKQKTQYVCKACGRKTAAYMGRCPRCGEFDTMNEELIVETAVSTTKRRRAGIMTQPQRIANIAAEGYERLKLPIVEFSRVLGGGMVPGSLILVGGDPGIGKSTLLLEIAALTANQHGVVLYISGEESERQIKMRADRLGLTAHDLFLVTETNLAAISDHIQQTKPVVVIVDSIQTTYTEDSKSSAGSVTQVRECASHFQSLAKVEFEPKAITTVIINKNLVINIFILSFLYF